MENTKVCVEVTAKFDTDGTMTPVSFVWEDGIIYNIDQIKAKERCVSQRSGDTGIVYTVVVAGKECHLFYKTASVKIKGDGSERSEMDDSDEKEILINDRKRLRNPFF